MTNICSRDNCTGCGVCVAICPKHCVAIEGDEFGYGHSVVDDAVCINCGLCQTICPNNRAITYNYPKAAYAAWALSEKERQSSTSGGVASVFARKIVEQGGAVYGAVGVGAYSVEHQRVDSIEDIVRFKNSKYVQSTIGADIYKQIKQDLSVGKHVLFIGTPCQTAAVRGLSHSSGDYLVCVDLICHGTPSSQLLCDHVKMAVGEKINQITSFSTRDGGGYVLKLFNDKKLLYSKPFPDDAYLNAFQYGLFFRPSCYHCPYARPERQSDLTIGDFWGLGKTDYPHNKVSVILVNTQIGEDLLSSVEDKLFLDKRTVEEAVLGNNNLKQPSAKHEFYDLFRSLYLSHGYSVAIKQSLRKFYIKYTIYRLLAKVPCFNMLYASIKQKS